MPIFWRVMLSSPHLRSKNMNNVMKMPKNIWEECDNVNEMKGDRIRGIKVWDPSLIPTFSGKRSVTWNAFVVVHAWFGVRMLMFLCTLHTCSEWHCKKTHTKNKKAIKVIKYLIKDDALGGKLACELIFETLTKVLNNKHTHTNKNNYCQSTFEFGLAKSWE